MTTRDLVGPHGGFEAFGVFEETPAYDTVVTVNSGSARPPGWQRLILLLASVAVAHVGVMAWFAATATNL